MVRRLSMVVGLMMLAGCSGMTNPFVKEAPFVATAVPGDFAIVVEENHLTYINRQTAQQVITAADAMSRTTTTKYRDFGNTVIDRYTQERTLTPAELQEMWDVVAKEKLLEGTPFWVNFLSDSDLHQRNSIVLKISAGGKSRTYQEVNSVPEELKPLVVMVNKVRVSAGGSGAGPMPGVPELIAAPTDATTRQ
jgi:hypothetical protein